MCCDEMIVVFCVDLFVLVACCCLFVARVVGCLGLPNKTATFSQR
jgi:hypothetical protein